MDGTREERIRAARSAVEAQPDDLPARLRLAAALLESGDPRAALEQFTFALARDPANVEALNGAAAAAAAAGDATRAEGYQRLLHALAASPHADPVKGSDESGEAGVGFLRRPRLRVVHRGEPASEEWRVEKSALTLVDVGGMEAVKRRLNVAFLAPLRNPDLRKLYGKSLRGGLLLFGPPGCGKTFIARAAAGELGAKFMAVGLSDVLDMWLGESERKLHEIFEAARKNAPCVLFFDELDALGQKRTHLKHHGGRTVVNQLLAELDGVRSEENEGIFVLGATNHPWDVDAALVRPGRFDRRILVLPPDEAARDAILRYHLQARPIDGLDVRWVASRTPDFSGADLAHLCESAAEIALEASASSAAARPITLADFQQALKDVRASTRPWFETARNYALFANDSGVFDDLLAYMRTHKML
ncbi:MAG TPA: ATP-binding protein [bacterium]|nr:ATP-binding protein [bacterium]